MTGTIVNIAAILTGCSVGWGLRQRLPPQLGQTLIQALGVFTLLLGLQMFAEGARAGTLPLLVLGALLMGTVIGESLHLEQRLQHLGHYLERTLGHLEGLNQSMSHAFVTSSLLFAIGPMAVLGSIQDGLNQDPSILYVKSVMDGVISIAFTTTLGLGTAFSCLPVLILQGSLTLLAAQAQVLVTPAVIGGLNSIGGLLLVSISLNLLGIMKIPVTNLLPSLAIAPTLVLLWAQYHPSP
jgi:uncharacterized protein